MTEKSKDSLKKPIVVHGPISTTNLLRLEKKVKRLNSQSSQGKGGNLINVTQVGNYRHGGPIFKATAQLEPKIEKKNIDAVRRLFAATSPEKV
ncbi:MAG TPA: hypothetical protein PKI61_03900 [bacterium]|nr:hypothetical protein [bacterium]HPT29770.1 hypothetical protein [bacterium]